MDAVKFNSIPKEHNEVADVRGISSDTAGIYISVPFCRAKCSYCNFASGIYSGDRIAAYLNRLVQDIGSIRAQAEARGVHPPRTVDTIYLGGGTPSLLDCNQMGSVVQAIRDAFSCSPTMEFTLECAPGQLGEELLEALPSFGINRVSLGVQSFVNREAKAVGRMHTRAVVLEEISRLRSVGIENINVDLIAGLPHQTPASWLESLDQAIQSDVPHVSIYMLDVDEDSRLGREMLGGGTRYGVGLVPSESLIAEMYVEACEQLAIAGIGQYEISNFSRSGFESRHNLKYWLRQPYIGFGLDAHSFLPIASGGEVRVATTDDLDEYLSNVVPAVLNPVSRAEAVEEVWFLRLRLNAGLSLAEAEREIGSAAMSSFQPALRQCLDDETLEYRGGTIRLTARGKLFANEVFARFVGVLDGTEETRSADLALEEGVLA